MDVYGHFLGVVRDELARAPVPLRGQFHGVGDPGAYHTRIDAVNFALSADDGLGGGKIRHGRPDPGGRVAQRQNATSLCMATQYGMRIAHYPLTPENFERPGLPASLVPHRKKLRGLTLSPERLHQVRSGRRPNSHYASIETCREELEAAEVLMRTEGIPRLETTHRSIEELAALLKLPASELAVKAVQ